MVSPLCQDGLPQYFTLSQGNWDRPSDGHAAHGKHVFKGIFHNQNVNACHSRLKEWLGRFLELKIPAVPFSRAILQVIRGARSTSFVYWNIATLPDLSSSHIILH